MIKKLKQYLELITLISGVISGAWFGLVRPAVERIQSRFHQRVQELVKDEVSLLFYLTYEMADSAEVARAESRWLADKQRKEKEYEYQGSY